MSSIKRVTTTILKDERLSDLYQEVLENNKKMWHRHNFQEDLNKWLLNFLPEEYYYALRIVNNFFYYNKREIDFLFGLLVSNRLRVYLVGKGVCANRNFELFLENDCLFIGLGFAEKSGPHMIYPFNKSNGYNLKYQDLGEFLALGKVDNKCIFLVDDFIGSGNQAIDIWNKVKHTNSLKSLAEANTASIFCYISLAGFTTGMEIIRNECKIDVITIEEYGEEFRCFSDNGIVFDIEIERLKGKEIMRSKGEFLYPSFPLGYDNSEALIAFEHNTPDNTLPVIWKRESHNGWYPLFERK